MKQLLPLLLKLSFIGSLVLLSVDIFTYIGAFKAHFFVSPLLIAISIAIVHIIIRWRTGVSFGTNFAKITMLGAAPFFLTLYTLMDHFEEFSSKVFYPNYFFENVEIDLRSLLPFAVAIFSFGIAHSTRLFWQRYVGFAWFTLTFWIIMLAGIFYFNNLGDPRVWNDLVTEDGPVEYGTSIAFAAAGILTLMLPRYTAQFAKTQRARTIFTWLCRLVGVGLIMIALEEISWGQRIFNFETPENLAEVNTQKELTIHNNIIVWPIVYWSYFSVGLFGCVAFIFAWILKDLLPKTKVVANWLLLMAPKPYLFLNFFLIVLYVWLRKVNGFWQYNKLEEFAELILAVGIVTHLVVVLIAQRERSKP